MKALSTKTIPQTMELLNLCQASVYKLINNGTLHKVKLGTRTMVKTQSINDLIESGGSETVFEKKTRTLKKTKTKKVRTRQRART